MYEHKNDTIAENKSRLAKKAEAKKELSDENNKTFSSGNSVLDHANGRIGDPSITQSHASTLRRAKDSNSSQAGHFLLQLQRQYGNSYVQRVIDLSRKADSDASVAPEIEQSIQQARGGGQALDSKVRGQMESSFGADFSNVRVHTNSQANMLNRELSSRAFATGQDIFFRQGEYSPSSSGGRELLAHELTHVVQQTGGVHGKMSVGQPGDKYEQEADEVARGVMQQEHQTVSKEANKRPVQRQPEEEGEELQVQPLEEEEELQAKPIAEQIAPLIRKQPIEEEEKEEVQTKPLVQKQEEEEEELVQAKAEGEQSFAVKSSNESAIQSMIGGGQPLQKPTRACFEPRFEHDFRQVKIHNNVQPDSLNRTVNARAFTPGKDIFFRKGEYNTGSSGGRELTHVVQHPGGIQGKMIVGQPGDEYEREADQVARAVMQQEQQAVVKKADERLVQQQPKEEEEEEIQVKSILGQHTPLGLSMVQQEQGNNFTQRLVGPSGNKMGKQLIIPSVEQRVSLKGHVGQIYKIKKHSELFEYKIARAEDNDEVKMIYRQALDALWEKVTKSNLEARIEYFGKWLSGRKMLMRYLFRNTGKRDEAAFIKAFNEFASSVSRSLIRDLTVNPSEGLDIWLSQRESVYLKYEYISKIEKEVLAAWKRAEGKTAVEEKYENWIKNIWNKLRSKYSGDLSKELSWFVRVRAIGHDEILNLAFSQNVFSELYAATEGIHEKRQLYRRIKFLTPTVFDSVMTLIGKELIQQAMTDPNRGLEEWSEVLAKNYEKIEKNDKLRLYQHDFEAAVIGGLEKLEVARIREKGIYITKKHINERRNDVRQLIKSSMEEFSQGVHRGIRDWSEYEFPEVEDWETIVSNAASIAGGSGSALTVIATWMATGLAASAVATAGISLIIAGVVAGVVALIAEIEHEKEEEKLKKLRKGLVYKKSNGFDRMLELLESRLDLLASRIILKAYQDKTLRMQLKKGSETSLLLSNLAWNTLFGGYKEDRGSLRQDVVELMKQNLNREISKK